MSDTARPNNMPVTTRPLFELDLTDILASKISADCLVAFVGGAENVGIELAVQLVPQSGTSSARGWQMGVLGRTRRYLEGLTGSSPRHKAQQTSMPIAAIPIPLAKVVFSVAIVALTPAAGLTGAPHRSSRVTFSP